MKNEIGFQPAEGFIVIKETTSTKTESGIILPEGVKETDISIDQLYVSVVAVSDIDPKYKIGDEVFTMMQKYQPLPIKTKEVIKDTSINVSYYIVHENSIYGKKVN